MLDLLIIQPTPFCNIDCSYCYLPDRKNTGKISQATIEKIADRLLESNLLQKDFTVVFHAGEPLVLPPSFYRHIFETLNARFSGLPYKVSYSIQTNGMLITHEWCELINEFEVRIGVSIDGPQFIHDAKRKNRNGKGTFNEAMRGVGLLQKHGIRYHSIAVVGEHSLNHAAEIFSFFYDNGFYSLGLNIEELEGNNQSAAINQSQFSEKIEQFYHTMFELFVKSDRKMMVREFQSSFGAILRQPEIPDITELRVDTHQTVPFGIITIDHLGNFSTFSPELLGQKAPAYHNFILGNVHTSPLENPERADLLARLKHEIANGLDKCKGECPYFPVCGGGAPANKFYENGSFETTETQYCKYHIKSPINITLNYLENNLA